MKSYLFLFLLFLGFLSLPVLGFSQEGPARQGSASQEEPAYPFHDFSHDQTFNPPREYAPYESGNFQTKFINMLVILGLLIAFMVVASVVLKRMMRSRINQLNLASTIKVLETRQLSPRSTLYLLDVQGHGLLIAESQTAVTYLASLPLHGEHEEDHHAHST